MTEPTFQSPPGIAWERWRRLRRVIDLAESTGVVPISDAVSAHLEALQVSIGGVCPEPTVPVRRELIRLRERTAWVLRSAGWTQVRIAAELGVSQAAVSKALARVDRRTLARMEADSRAAKLRQAGQLQYILSQALQSWRESKEESERRVVASETLGDRHGCTPRRTTTFRSGPGNPQFLAIALKAMAAERALFGLDRPSDPKEREGSSVTATRTQTESITIRGPLPQ